MDSACVSEREVIEFLFGIFDDFSVEIDGHFSVFDIGGGADDGADIAVIDVFVVVVFKLHDAVADAESLERKFDA